VVNKVEQMINKNSIIIKEIKKSLIRQLIVHLPVVKVIALVKIQDLALVQIIVEVRAHQALVAHLQTKTLKNYQD